MDDIGRGFGCTAMLLIAAIPAPMLLFVLAWSGAHCEPMPQCQRQSELITALMFAAVLVVAVLVGLGTRKILNTMAAKREDEGTSLAFLVPAGLLTAGSVALALIGMYCLATMI